MTRRLLRVLLPLALIVTVAFAAAGIAAAQEEGEVAETTETTVGFPEGREPAVQIAEAGEAESDPAWTFRYLVPTLLALTGLLLLALFVWYLLGIKGRYRVVR